MNKNLLLLGILSCALTMPAVAEEVEDASKAKAPVTENGESVKKNVPSRFTIGGYGEAVMSRNSTASTSTATATPTLTKTTPATDASTCHTSR